MKEVTIGSWNYFVGHQFQKVATPCFMGSTRLERSNINYYFFIICQWNSHSKIHEN